MLLEEDRSGGTFRLRSLVPSYGESREGNEDQRKKRSERFPAVLESDQQWGIDECIHKVHVSGLG